MVFIVMIGKKVRFQLDQTLSQTKNVNVEMPMPMLTVNMEIRVTGVVISLWVTSLSRTVASLRKYGKNFDNDPLTMHRIIWYQFMYHVDCEIPIPEKSIVWTMQFSHKNLEHHDASSLAMDTFSKWKSIKFSTPMDTERETIDWIAVGAPR